MFTIFTTPKPFRGAALRDQKNAILSWICIPNCDEILVFGEGGDKDVIEKLGVHYIGDCARNPCGLPRVDAMFEQAQDISTNDLLAFVNTDIILFPAVSVAIDHAATKFEQFMMVGQRLDVDIDWLIDYNSEWEHELQDHVQLHGKLHPPCGKDYFVFRRPLPLTIPPFNIARCAYDNYLITASLEAKIPVIDATQAITAIHCNHVIYDSNFRQDPDYQYNIRLGGQDAFKGHINNAPWVMHTDYQIRRRSR